MRKSDNLSNKEHSNFLKCKNPRLKSVPIRLLVRLLVLSPDFFAALALHYDLTADAFMPSNAIPV